MKKPTEEGSKFEFKSKKTAPYDVELANTIYNYKNMLNYAPTDCPKQNDKAE